ncbi:MAG: hypothetical protein EPN84_12380 [Legionella sp.]|nr:MAG: hypothetical protein EPN84_12380 [Legionella sp.]
MSWRDGFWKVCSYVSDTTINATADLFNTVGSLACMVGGAGYATSYVMNGSLGGNYYGGAHALGDVAVRVYVSEYNYTYLQNIPLDRSISHSGSFSENINNYIHPNTFLGISTICTLSGIALRIASANLKTWQRSREDKQFAQENYHTVLRGPSIEEIMQVNAASLLGSLGIVCQTNAIVTGLINLSNFLGSVSKVTYPADSKIQVNSTDYSGPVNATVIPFSGELDENATLELPIVGKLHLTVSVIGNGIINGTYGGDVLLQSNSKPNDNAIALPAFIGVSSYLASGFFAKKVSNQRDQRMQEASRSGFSLV